MLRFARLLETKRPTSLTLFRSALLGMGLSAAPLASNLVSCEHCVERATHAGSCDACGGLVASNCSSGNCGSRDRSLSLPRLGARFMDSLDHATDSFERSFGEILGGRSTSMCSCSDTSCADLVPCGACDAGENPPVYFEQFTSAPTTHNHSPSTPQSTAPKRNSLLQPPTEAHDHSIVPALPPSVDVPPATPSQDYLRDPFRDDARSKPNTKTRQLNRYTMTNQESSAADQTERREIAKDASTVNRYASSQPAKPTVKTASFTSETRSVSTPSAHAIRRSISSEALAVEQTEPKSSRRDYYITQDKPSVVQAAATIDLSR